MPKPPVAVASHGKPVTVLRHISSSADSMTFRRHILVIASADTVDDLLWRFRQLRGKLDVTYASGVPDADFWAQFASDEGGDDQQRLFATVPYADSKPREWHGPKIDPAIMGDDWAAFVTFLQRRGVECHPLPGIHRGGDHFDPLIGHDSAIGVFDLLEAPSVAFIDVKDSPFE